MEKENNKKENSLNELDIKINNSIEKILTDKFAKDIMLKLEKNWDENVSKIKETFQTYNKGLTAGEVLLSFFNQQNQLINTAYIKAIQSSTKTFQLYDVLNEFGATQLLQKGYIDITKDMEIKKEINGKSEVLNDVYQYFIKIYNNDNSNTLELLIITFKDYLTRKTITLPTNIWQSVIDWEKDNKKITLQRVGLLGRKGRAIATYIENGFDIVGVMNMPKWQNHFLEDGLDIILIRKIKAKGQVVENGLYQIVSLQINLKNGNVERTNFDELIPTLLTRTLIDNKKSF